MTETYLKILAAVAPAIVLAIIMIRKDKRREPIGWLLATVGLGVLVAPAVLLLGHLYRYFHRGVSRFVYKCSHS